MLCLNNIMASFINSLHRKRLNIFCYLLALISLPGWSLDLVDAYIENVEQGSSRMRIQTYKKICDYSGISEIKLFDIVQAQVLAQYQVENLKGEDLEALAWAVKTLGASGNSKYKPTIEKVITRAAKSKVRKHAKTALQLIDDYARWNPVIDSKKYSKQGRSDTTALWMRYIDSGYNDLALIGIKKAHDFKMYNPEITTLVVEKLKARYKTETDDEADLEFQAWSIRYLSDHPNFGKYTSLLNDIAEGTPNKKIRKWALKSLG